MINTLDSAQESLDLCVYLVTCQDYNGAILRAYERGVRVRLITDHIMAHGTSSVVPLCIAAGIPVRMHDKHKMMHRKSAMVDGKLLLFGTGNWTMQAITGNFETWIVTTDVCVVREYTRNFEYQWREEGIIEPTMEEFKKFSLRLN